MKTYFCPKIFFCPPTIQLFNPLFSLFDDKLFVKKFHLDKKDYALIGNVVTKLRFSEYLPFDKVSEHIFRLREFSFCCLYFLLQSYQNSSNLIRHNFSLEH